MISQIASAVTVGGVVMVWTYFTLKTFRTCKQIVLPPPKEVRTERCEYCSRNFPYYEGSHKRLICQSIYVCKQCAHIEKHD